MENFHLLLSWKLIETPIKIVSLHSLKTKLKSPQNKQNEMFLKTCKKQFI